MDNNPMVFRSWSNQFKSFFNTSRLNLCEVQDQHAYLRTCLDPELEEKITDQLDDTTPVFGAGGCLEIITEKFNERYPLATRRNDFFQLTQQENQRFSDVATKLNKLG